jgi:putative endonuclease
MRKHGSWRTSPERKVVPLLCSARQPQIRLESGVPFVYILRCGDGSLYTGVTKDLERRIAQHRAGRASRYTRSRLPVSVVWSREVETWGDALREEIRIKALSRAAKEELLR